ncbi:hypothetical protein N665_0152s0038 [Sinapis alba]|nr:hypothetical protein N665_0152s0038 [Sinapis alba]
MQRLYFPDLLFLIETKQQNDYVCDIGVYLDFDHMTFVPPIGISGGLAVFRKEYVYVSCISSDVHMVNLHVQYKAFQFYLSCIYGGTGPHTHAPASATDPNPQHRHVLWERLQRLAVSRIGGWMICGDCNEITRPEEKKGGRVRSLSSVQNFNTMIEICGMEDLQFKGNQLSWVGRRRTEIIECCLDRVLVNSEWKNKYPFSDTEYLELAESDHRPMIISIDYQVRSRKGLFRYDKRLFNEHEFVETISDAWRYTESINNWSSKLDHCRRTMIQWKRDKKTNSAVKIQELRSQIDQALRDSSVTTEFIQDLRVQLNKAFLLVFYHGLTKMKRSKNKIKEMFDKNGILHSQDETIALIAEEYFLEMFSRSDNVPLSEVLPTITKLVTDEMNQALTR